ncbi:MAG: anaerobic ribonucleoside-triphosphate reductase [Candidatus Margulisiibacteriota bacterium]|jgi:ribonucleoside-triphosphate reductase
METKEQIETMEDNCNEETEVYSRVVGFYRPVKQWNPGKQEEFTERQTYKEKN